MKHRGGWDVFKVFILNNVPFCVYCLPLSMTDSNMVIIVLKKSDMIQKIQPVLRRNLIKTPIIQIIKFKLMIPSYGKTHNMETILFF